MHKKRRKILLLTVKTLIAAALLAVVFRQVEWGRFVQTLRNVRTNVLIAGSLGFGLSLLTIALRWWYLLRVQEIPVRRWQAVRLTFLAQFFHAVVPGTWGGDLVKTYYVVRQTPKKAAVLLSVFLDRLMGLTELALMAAVMLCVVLAAGLETFEQMSKPAGLVAAVLAIVAAAVTFLLSARFRRLFHLDRLYRRLPIAHHIAAAGDAARVYARHPGLMGWGMLLTVVAHVFFIGAICLMGVSLRLPVPWYSYFVYVPLIYIVGAVPLTPGGVGVVEAGFGAAFAGLAAGQVLALALLARLIPMLWGLPGAIVLVTGPKLPKLEQLEADLVIDEEAA
jgi:hypothetical protein